MRSHGGGDDPGDSLARPARRGHHPGFRPGHVLADGEGGVRRGEYGQDSKKEIYRLGDPQHSLSVLFQASAAWKPWNSGHTPGA